MKLKKNDGVPISVSNAAKKLIKKWKSVAEKAEANATTKTDVTLKTTTITSVLNRSTVAKSKASKGNVASTNLQQQVMNQQFGQKPSPRDNVNQNGELSWAFPKNRRVPANVVKELTNNSILP
jgi:hypothetical protein